MASIELTLHHSAELAQIADPAATQATPLYADLLNRHGFTEVDGLVMPQRETFEGIAQPEPIVRQEEPDGPGSPLSDHELKNLVVGLRALRPVSSSQTGVPQLQEIGSEPKMEWFASTTSNQRVTNTPVIPAVVPAFTAPTPDSTSGRASVAAHLKLHYDGRGTAPAPAHANLQTAQTATIPAVRENTALVPVIPGPPKSETPAQTEKQGAQTNELPAVPQPDALRHASWVDTPSHNARLEAFFAPEEESTPSGSRFMGFIRRIGAVVTRASQPVMEETTQAAPEAPVIPEVQPTPIVPEKPSQTNQEIVEGFIGKLPPHITLEERTENGRTSLYLVEREQLSRMQRIGRLATFRTTEAVEARSMPLDMASLKNSETTDDIKHMFGLRATGRSQDADKYRGTRRRDEATAEELEATEQFFKKDREYQLSKRNGMPRFRFLAKAAGFVAIGGAPALGAMLYSENGPEKIEAAQRFVETLLN